MCTTYLIVLDRQIVALFTLLVCDLHEETITQYFLNVGVPLFLVYGCEKGYFKALHSTL